MATKRGPRSAGKSVPERGFYALALDEAEAMELAAAAGVEGLDGEIAVLRLKLRRLLEEHPDRVDLHTKVLNTLARLVATRYKISAEEKSNLKEALSTVIKDVAIPLGLKFIP